MIWFALGCTASSLDTSASRTLFEAGFRDLEFVDHRGKELTATVWYPAEVSDQAQVDNYEPFNVALEGYRNAPIAVSGAPLIAFSHGFFAIRYQSAFLMEHLAQRGYVIVAVDHPQNVLYDFADEATPQVLLERPDDVRSSVDELLRRAADDADPLYGVTGGEQYVAIGHSFGSHTANVLGGGRLDYNGLVAYCAENPNEQACRYLDGLDLSSVDEHGTIDERVVAVVPMSPGLWYTFGADGIGLSAVTDSLLMAGTEDAVLQYDSEALPTFHHTGTPKYLATFANTGHYGFTNICDLLPIFTEECTEEDWADVVDVQEATETLVTAFVDHHLKNTERSSVLTESFWQTQSLVTIQTDP